MSVTLTEFKKALSFLSNTPFHPQWLIYGARDKYLKQLSFALQGKILDIGCANKSAKLMLDHDVQYVGLDYATALTLYKTRPDIFGSAEKLPIADNSVNVVLLLDVLEHVKDPFKAISEISRVLVEGGRLVINVPFIYPLHDFPYDYQRFTLSGLRNLLEINGLKIEQECPLGNALETSGLLFNLALCNTAVTSLEKRHPGCFIIILLPILVPVINILSYFAGILFKSDHFMPYRYHLLAVK